MRLAFPAILAVLLAVPPSRGDAPPWWDLARRLDSGAPAAPQNAYLAAWLASLAQSDPRSDGPGEARYQARVSAILRDAGFDTVEFPRSRSRWFPDTDTQCLVAVSRDHLVIAFRGTEAKLGDVLQDAEFALTPVGPGERGRVHTGFRRGFRSVEAPLLATVHRHLTRPDGSERSVWVTGHSLGGALAELCALRLERDRARHGLPPLGVSVLTFGSPRVGDARYRAAYDAAVPSSRRYVYHRDVVPRLPPRLPPLPAVPVMPAYVHAGRALHFDAAYRPWTPPREPQLLDYGPDLGPALAQLIPRDPTAWIREGRTPRIGPRLVRCVNALGRPKADHALGHYLNLTWRQLPAEEQRIWPGPGELAPRLYR